MNDIFAFLQSLPEKEKVYFERYYVFISKYLALKSEMGQISFYTAKIRRVMGLLQDKKYDEAREFMINDIMDIQRERMSDFGCILIRKNK